MEIITYTTDNIVQYFKDLMYWSNAMGELHYHGEYDISEEELPEELKAAYNNLWEDGTGSLCYLTEYKGQYKIALINEFDDDTAELLNTSKSDMIEHMMIKAEQFSSLKEFESTQIIIAEKSGFYECHEFVVLIPCNSTKETFKQIAETLYNEVYKKIETE